jgi:hypothetical protein
MYPTHARTPLTKPLTTLVVPRRVAGGYRSSRVSMAHAQTVFGRQRGAQEEYSRRRSSIAPP